MCSFVEKEKRKEKRVVFSLTVILGLDKSKLKPVVVCFSRVFVMFDLKNIYFQHMEKPVNRKKV